MATEVTFLGRGVTLRAASSAACDSISCESCQVRFRALLI